MRSRRLWVLSAVAVWTLSWVSGCGGGQSPSTAQDPQRAQQLSDTTTMPTGGGGVGGRAAQAPQGPVLPLVRDLVLRDKLAYVLIPDGLAVVDVAKPGEPTILGTALLSKTPKRLVVDGLRAYVACGPGGLQIVDLTRPKQPAVMGAYTPNLGEVTAVAVRNGLALVGMGPSGVAVVDVGEPSAPVEKKLLNLKNARDLCLNGGFGYVMADKVTILDLRKPADPQVVGGYELKESLQALSMHYDNTVLVTDKQLLLMNLAMPQKPWVVDHVAVDAVKKQFGETAAAVTSANAKAQDSPPTTPAEPSKPAPPVKAVKPAAALATDPAGGPPAPPATPVVPPADAKKPATPAPKLELQVPRAVVIDDRLLVSRGDGGVWIFALDGGKSLTPLLKVTDVSTAVAASFADGLLAVGTPAGEVIFWLLDGKELKRVGSLKVAEVKTAAPPAPGLPPNPGTAQGQDAIRATPDPRPGVPAGAPAPS